MALPSLFYTYIAIGTNHELVSLYTTQAEANVASIMGGSNIQANVGEREVINQLAPGWIWDTTVNVWRLPVINDLPGLERLKSDSGKVHDTLVSWAYEFNRVSTYWESNAASKVHDWFRWLHFGVNQVVRSSHWTHLQHINFLETTLLGPSDATITEDNATLVSMFSAMSVDSLPAPTGAVLLCDPNNTNTRFSLMSAGTMTAGNTIGQHLATPPLQETMVDGIWIASLT